MAENEPVVVKDVLLIDGTTAEPREATVVVADGRVADIRDAATGIPAGARVFDGSGRTMIPGLIDAHVHIGATDVDFGTQAARKPMSLIAVEMTHRLRSLLERGYTTVRDCGGADWGFKQAVERGLISGPDLLICCSMISQTGGHGDMRPRADLEPPGTESVPFGMTFSVADGTDPLRRSVREQVRRGADFIKVMASGGAASPTDKLECAQYSVDELRIVVEEAARAGLYVAAHALPKPGIEQALKAGARTIEHGNFLDDELARQMAAAGVALVPTVATYVVASRHPEKYDDPPEVVAKISQAAQGALSAVESAYRAGVAVGSGSDLLGDELEWIVFEHQFRADVVGAARAIEAATSQNASILGLEDRGVIAPGKRADFVLLDDNPLEKVGILGDPQHVLAVVKSGRVQIDNT